MEIKEIQDELKRIGTEAKEAGVKAASDEAAKLIKEANELLNQKAETMAQEQKTALEGLKVKQDEKDKEIEEALTKMNRLKEQDREERTKSMSGVIGEAISENMEKIKSYSTTPGKKSLDFNLSEQKAVGVMGVPDGMVQPQMLPTQMIPHTQDRLRQVLPVFPTNSTSIKYLQWTKKEGGIGMVAPGALKQQIDYASTAQEAPVRKIAGWVDVLDEFLEDVVGAREFLAYELPQSLLDVEDFQILRGDGTGQNLLGLMNVAAALTLPVGTVTTASNNWDKIAAGLVQIRRNLRAPSDIFISPEAYLELLINKGNTEEYTYPIFVNGDGRITIGGAPVYQHSQLEATEGIAGDFRRGAAIYQKAGAIIKFSNENKDNFVHNITTVLIEERLALPIIYPESFVKYDFTVAPAV